MPMLVLGYSSLRQGLAPRLRPTTTIAGILIFAFGVLAIVFVPVRQTRYRIDAVSGSMEEQTAWKFGITGAARVDPSALDQRLMSAGISWTRDWRTITVLDQNLLGITTCRACNTAPPIYSARPAMQQFARSATTEQLREFVQIMQTGTDGEQHSTLKAAIEREFPGTGAN